MQNVYRSMVTGILCMAAALGASAAERTGVGFKDVAPILEQHCIRCHTPGNAKGEISLATAADLRANDYVVPGDPDSSYLLELVSGSRDAAPAMPKEGVALSDEQVAIIREWIRRGAEWPEGVVVREASKADTSWWSLQPLTAAPVPAPEGIPASWQSHPIDRFVYAKLAEQNLQVNPRADRRELIQRATYDLTGLPPTPEEVAAFEADDSPGAYERLVDRLLGSPRYGERWGRHWLDIIRFGESRGYERNEIINNLWPLRDYVIRSLNNDKPIDQMIREHLAGDVLGEDDPQTEVASAFLVAGPYDDVGNQDPAQAAQIRANTIDEMIRTTSESFLGLTVGCARCHDHKFDPILQRDYYRLYATFAGVQHGEREVATREQREARSEQLRPLQERRGGLAERAERLRQQVLERANERSDHYASRWTRPAPSRRGTTEEFAPVEAQFVRLVVEGQEENPDARSGYRIEEFEVWTDEPDARNVALRSRGATAEGASRVADDFADAYSAGLTIDGRLGASWIAAGPELTVSLAEPMTIDRVTFSSDRSGAAGDQPIANFVSEYRILVSLDGDRWQEVASSHDRQPINDRHRQKRLLDGEITGEERQELETLQRELADVDRQIAAVPALPVWWIGRREEAPGPFHIFLGGSPQRLGDEVLPASLSILSHAAPAYELPAESPEAERRVALAEWIVHPQNPLTARVLANRLWHYHFGTGIVDTPNDLGYMGGRPTHPELLDWLARQVHEQDWKLKSLHKLIMTSQTYQQSSEFEAASAEVDADARLLWRYPPRRLSAEEIRDTMLSVAGRLDASMGGPGFRLYRYLQDNVATYVPLDEVGPETYRRAVYHQNARAARVDLMTDFDQPDCAFSAPQRAETTTPLQALTLLNHDFTLDMAQAFAERLQKEVSQDDPAARLRRAYQLCYARDPSDEELRACRALVQDHGWIALCRVLFNTSELIYVE